MDYQLLPMGDIWADGMFTVPTAIVNKYIRLASAYQLKALLVILAGGGKATSNEISKATGIAESDLCDLLSFWVEEGVLLENGSSPAPKKAEIKQPESPKTEKKIEKKVVESVPVPQLNTKDINHAMLESSEIASLMQSAEEVLGRSTSTIEKGLIINMVNYYGLPCEIVLMILQYYKSEKEKHRAIGTAYIGAMAKNWSEEGIDTIDAAEEKLKEIEESDKSWNEIVELSGIRHRNPTVNQREMIKRWRADFSMEMIALACDAMKENADKPTLKYVDSVLKNWKKKGIATPDDVAKDTEKHNAEKNGKKSGGGGEITSTYDLDKIAKDTMFNDDYDI